MSNKKQHRKGSARNFFSPNIVGLRSKTPHTVRFEITVTPRDGILFTATPHKKISDTATPQIPMSPSYRLTTGTSTSKVLNKFSSQSCLNDLKAHEARCSELYRSCCGEKLSVIIVLFQNLWSGFLFSADSNVGFVWFCLSALGRFFWDWRVVRSSAFTSLLLYYAFCLVKKLAPFYQSSRRWRKTNPVLLSFVFPRLAHVTCVCFEFWLVHCGLCISSDWTEN